jgi:formylglycine-generating enzyme
MPHLGEDASSMSLIPGGPFRYGCDRRDGQPSDSEGPSLIADLPAFRMDRWAVNNARFARFVDATGYVTDAERAGWSFVFAGLLPDDFQETRGIAAAPWWREVLGACWRQPEGPHSDVAARNTHPVVHVSHADALAFCAWAGKRLPTETEWEKAARGGLENMRFPWGDEETPRGLSQCNVWQGVFPARNDLIDGFYGTAPVDAFAANGYGLFNMAGNTWEWCADWSIRRRHPAHPAGPSDGELRVLRGGSYLCHPSYCWRYRNAARSSSTPDSADVGIVDCGKPEMG